MRIPPAPFQKCIGSGVPGSFLPAFMGFDWGGGCEVEPPLVILDDDASIGYARGAAYAQFCTQIVENTNAWLERARILLLPVTGQARIAQVR